jgi:hypothetical protein
VPKSSASRKFAPAVWIVIVAVAAVAAGLGLRAHSRSASMAKLQGTVRASMDTLPLAFEANQGQTDPTVKYLARGSGYTVFLTENEAVFALKSQPAAHAQVTSRHALGAPSKDRAKDSGSNDREAAIRLNLIGGNAQPQISASNPLPGHSNYFIGNDRSQWRANVEHYGRVSYRDIYPGVDMTFYGGQKQLEFDFVVSPGASASPIRLGVSGADHVATDDEGNLVLTASTGTVQLRKPVAYQEKDGAREPVDVLFVQHATHQVSFVLGNYDHSRALVIDPSVSYATYLGGSAEDDAYGIAIDGNGDAYLTGQTASTDFPTVLPEQHAYKGGATDAFVTKISADGSSLIYSTYVGGSGADSGNAIAVDGSGDAFVAGGTGSSNFPGTTGFYQPSLKGGLDAFVFELTPTGSALTYSTYLGGSEDDFASGIALYSGSAYVVGSTDSSDFPTKNPLQPSIAGGSNGFVTVLNSSGNALVYSTFLGGGTGDFASAIAVDSSGNAYVTGGTENTGFPVKNPLQPACGSDGTCNSGKYDAFVTVYNPTGSAYVYSTFLGGEGTDEGLGIAVDASGDAYVTGLTQSADFPLKTALFPTLGGTQDAFVTELNPGGTAMVYSTFLGGGLSDAGTSIAVDGNKNAYVTGQTGSSDFPTASPTQSGSGGGNDAFVSEIKSTGSALLFSTYLGGAADENTNEGSNIASIGSIAVNSTGANIYVAGNTASTDFPTVAAEQSTYGTGTDAFVAMYSQNSTSPDFTISGTALTGVTPGNSSTSTITIAPLNSYTGTVNFTCSVAAGTGGTPLPTCSIPTAVTGGTGTSTLTVNSTGAAQARNRGAGSIFYAVWLPFVGLSLVGMRYTTAGSRRKKLLGFLLLGVMMTALFLLPACSSSSNGGGGGGGGCSGCTPQGTYTVTVTGTDSTNANLTHSVSPALSLTVTDPLP